MTQIDKEAGEVKREVNSSDVKDTELSLDLVSACREMLMESPTTWERALCLWLPSV